MTPDQPSDPPRRHLDLGGHRLAYTDEGQGPAVLAVHGLPGSVRDWRWLAAALAGRVRLVRIDLPGFGESDAALSSTRVDDLAAVVLAAADALGLHRPILLAHSFGGAIVTAAAVRAEVRGLALLASIGRSPHASYRMVPVPRLLSLATRTPGLSALINPRLRAAMVRGGFPSSIRQEDAVRSVQIVASFDFAAHRDNLAALRCPTLVGWCEDDKLVEAHIGADLAEACPPGPRLGFATGGHNLQKTRAVEIAEALLELAAGPGDRTPSGG